LGYSPPWCVNAGIVAGDTVTLVIDTGANSLAAKTVHGYACAASQQNKLRVVNTEKHFDHIGGNGYFRGLGIDVWGHAGIERTAGEFQTEIDEFNNAIPDPVRRNLSEARAFFDETSAVNPNKRITEETRFELGGCDAEILLTPGHTETNLSVWIPEDGVLYTGDCLINRYLPNLDAGGPAEWRVWLESLDRIESLKPAVAVAGHGPVMRGNEIRLAIDSVRLVLEESIARGYSPTASR
jgi:glyoxylase-like metal-dependent hydrolase (beta-lactamase superfamily II)